MFLFRFPLSALRLPPSFLAGGALLACLGLTGCVTEPGRKGPALWTTVDTQSEDSDVQLKNPVRLHTSYGRVAEANGRRNVARKHYETALSNDPKCVDAILGVARLDQFDGQTRRAEAGIQQALKLAPKNPDVLQSAGLYYSSQGRWREAVASLNAAVAAAPNVSKHRYALAIVLAKSGDLNAAMPHLVASVGKAEAHSQMARLLLERGDRHAATQQIQLAMSLQPNLESARQLLNQLRTDDRRRNLARAATPATDRGGVRSVGHVNMRGDSGSYHDERRQAPPRYGDGRYGPPAEGQSLRIMPGTPQPQSQSRERRVESREPEDPRNPEFPALDSRLSPLASSDRFRPPRSIDGRGSEDASAGDSIPQWNHEGRNE